jgi:hypothetical protein
VSDIAVRCEERWDQMNSMSQSVSIVSACVSDFARSTSSSGSFLGQTTSGESFHFSVATINMRASVGAKFRFLAIEVAE